MKLYFIGFFLVNIISNLYCQPPKQILGFITVHELLIHYAKKSKESSYYLDNLQLLLKNRQLTINPNIPDNLPGLNTPLLYLVESPFLKFNNYLSIIDELLERKADINTHNFYGITPLHQACNHGHLTTIKKLISCNADINAQTIHGKTPLIITTNLGLYYCVDELMQHKPKIDLPDKNGNTALSHAIMNGRFEIAELLLSHGANHTLQNNQKLTPLMYAALTHSYNCTQLLLDYKKKNRLSVDPQEKKIILTTLKKQYKEVLKEAKIRLAQLPYKEKSSYIHNHLFHKKNFFALYKLIKNA